MPTILRIRPINGELCSVLFDDKQKLTLTAEVLVREQLKTGKAIEAEDFSRLSSYSDERRCTSYVLYMLGRRPHSRFELKRKLSKNYDGEMAGRVLDRLEEQGFINDEEYARAMALQLKQIRDYGKMKTASELHRKGVSREITEPLLEELFEEEDEIKRLARYIETRYVNMLDDREDLKKLVNKLLRRGFSYAVIKKALDTAEKG